MNFFNPTSPNSVPLILLSKLLPTSTMNWLSFNAVGKLANNCEPNALATSSGFTPLPSTFRKLSEVIFNEIYALDSSTSSLPCTPYCLRRLRY